MRMAVLHRGPWLALALLVLASQPLWAGGAWIPPAGKGEAMLGISNKTADQSWDPNGNTREHSSLHDFRYVYQSTEVGLGHGFSVKYLVLWLDGREGRPGEMEKNAGFSELYLGLKYSLTQGKWLTALAVDVRTSYLYDLPGPYDRHLFVPDEDDIDGDGDTTEAIFKGVSPEWRGLLGEDVGLSFLISRNVFSTGWLNLAAGYRYRTTNLSDEIPIYAELGYPLRWKELYLKGAYTWIQSVGNHSLDREPEDRFGCSERNCFPNASNMVMSLSVFRNFGSTDKWWLELGWNQWIWGRSARKYSEPFLSVGRRF